MKLTNALRSVGLLVILIGWNTAAALASNSTLVGTATTETGTAISADSVLKVLDSAGTLKMLTITKPGVYSIITNGMAPPLLIEAGNLFSYSLTGTGVANIDPTTDLIVNQIYQALGTSPAAQLAAAPAPPITLSTAQLASASALVNLAFQQPFNNFKIKSGFDSFTTKYTFSSAYDKFLTHSTFGGFGTATETVDSTFGSVSYGATFWALTSPVGTWVNWTANTSTPTSATSQSSYYAYYPSGIDATLAYAGIGTFFKNYQATLKHEGKLLDSINILPYYSTSYLNDGKDATLDSGLQANFLRTVKVSSFTRGVINAFLSGVPDSGHNVIGLDYYLAKTDQGLKVSDLKSAYFVCDTLATNCLFYGNQLSARFDLKTTWELDSFSATSVPAFGMLKARGSAPTGTVGSIVVSDGDGTFFNSSALNSNGQKTILYKPFHNLPPLSYVSDEWSLSHAALPPAIVYTDLFSIDLGLLPSGSQSFTQYAAGYTNETINLIKPSLTGGHTVGDLEIGKALKVLYSLPQSFIVTNIDLSGTVCSATMTQKIDSKPIKTTATSATIKLPKANGSEAVTDASFKLSFEGPRGERSVVLYGTNASCQ